MSSIWRNYEINVKPVKQIPDKYPRFSKDDTLYRAIDSFELSDDEMIELSIGEIDPNKNQYHDWEQAREKIRNYVLSNRLNMSVDRRKNCIYVTKKR